MTYKQMNENCKKIYLNQFEKYDNRIVMLMKISLAKTLGMDCKSQKYVDTFKSIVGLSTKRINENSD